MHASLRVNITEDHPDRYVFDIWEPGEAKVLCRAELAKPHPETPWRPYAWISEATGRLEYHLCSVPDHPQVRIRDDARDWEADVDEGMADEIRMLWDHGIRTESSCQSMPMVGLRRGERTRYVCLSSRADLDAALSLLPWARSVSKGRMGGFVFVAARALRDYPGVPVIWRYRGPAWRRHLMRARVPAR